MNQELINSIANYVEKNIGEFHKARIAKLQSINLKELLSRKNPYMYKAKNIVTAGQMVESLASAYMSSAERRCMLGTSRQLKVLTSNSTKKEYTILCLLSLAHRGAIPHR